MLGTKVGRLIAAELADPARLAALGSSRFIRCDPWPADPQSDCGRGHRLAKDALPTPDAAVARAVLAADLALLTDLDAQIDAGHR